MIIKKGTIFTCDLCGKECYELTRDVITKVDICLPSDFKPLNNMPIPEFGDSPADCSCGGKWVEAGLNSFADLHTKDGWIL